MAYHLNVPFLPSELLRINHVLRTLWTLLRTLLRTLLWSMRTMRRRMWTLLWTECLRTMLCLWTLWRLLLWIPLLLDSCNWPCPRRVHQNTKTIG